MSTTTPGQTTTPSSLSEDLYSTGTPFTTYTTGTTTTSTTTTSTTTTSTTTSTTTTSTTTSTTTDTTTTDTTTTTTTTTTTCMYRVVLEKIIPRPEQCNGIMKVTVVSDETGTTELATVLGEIVQTDDNGNFKHRMPMSADSFDPTTIPSFNVDGCLWLKVTNLDTGTFAITKACIIN